MNKAEQVSKESMRRAQSLITRCFGEDIQGVYGKWAFLHRPAFNRQWVNGHGGLTYSHLSPNHRGQENRYREIISAVPQGGVDKFFSDGAMVAVVTDNEEMVRAVSQLHKNVKVAFINVDELRRTGFKTGNNRRKFDRILVENIGGKDNWENIIRYLTGIAALGGRKRSTMLRATDLEEKRLGATTPEDMLSKLGWDILRPHKNKKQSEIIIGFL